MHVLITAVLITKKMKKLLILALLAISTIVYVATPATAIVPVPVVVSGCEVPDLVLPPPNVPLGPYCTKGGTPSASCLLACESAYLGGLYSVVSVAATKANDIVLEHAAVQSGCHSNLMSCNNEGGDPVVCQDTYDACMEYADCIAKNAMDSLQTEVDVQIGALTEQFYYCANWCCY